MGRLCSAWLPCLILSAGFITTHAVSAASGEGSAAKPAVWDGDFKAARELGERGEITLAEHTYQSILQQARAAGDEYQQARALTGIGTCQLRRFAFRKSLTTLLEAKQLAQRVHNPRLSGTISGNLASIYAQINSFPEALDEAEQAIREFQQAGEPAYLIRALGVKGSLLADHKDVEQARLAYQDAIALAQKSKDVRSEAFALDGLGDALSAGGDYVSAETALGRALQLRTSVHDDAAATTRLHLALLKLREGKAPLALEILDSVLASPGPAVARFPAYELKHRRGQILMALGRDDEALQTLREATEKADQWRSSALPGDVSSTGTVAYLHEVYADYTNFAARVAIQRRDPDLQRQALEVLSSSRAANLREEYALALAQQERLPDEYFALLKKIEAAEAGEILSPGADDEAKIRQLRGRLESIQDQTGIRLAAFSKDSEKNLHQKTLRHIQQSLGPEDVVLSFSLGVAANAPSYLWATTMNAVHVYALPSRETIEKNTVAFREAVRAGSGSEAAGQTLSRTLFQQLGRDTWHKRNWLLVPDGVLLDGVPWAALPEPGTHPVSQLVQRHSIRSLPSEYLLLVRNTGHRTNSFLALGDPIYNRADVRFEHVRRTDTSEYAVSARPIRVTLARLAGSKREVESSARAWNATATQLLMGRDASLNRLQSALDLRPGIIHFAVHVLSPDSHPEQIALALSIDERGLPELLTPEIISTFRLSGSLVVLSGCASQHGAVVAGAGLIGLSRAWLLAGASAVVVSAWPTPDDSGRFFEVFYEGLRRQNPQGNSIVEQTSVALQQAQLEMKRDNGYRRSPSYWAAYSLISKE
jgi:CHAT domain-containing protein/predicted negative regulator of RcsB-dependent stress response